MECFEDIEGEYCSRSVYRGREETCPKKLDMEWRRATAGAEIDICEVEAAYIHHNEVLVRCRTVVTKTSIVSELHAKP